MMTGVSAADKDQDFILVMDDLQNTEDKIEILHGNNIVIDIDENFEFITDFANDFVLGTEVTNELRFISEDGADGKVRSFPAGKFMHRFGSSYHKEMDTNKDGKVTKDEFIAAKNKYLSVSKSGVNFSKFQKLQKEAKAKHKTEAKKRKEAAKAKRIAKRAKVHFDKLDANNDGKVTRAEVSAAAAASFAKMDTNDDGVLNKDDNMHEMFAKHMKKMKGKHMQMMKVRHLNGEMSVEQMEKSVKRMEEHLKEQKERLVKAKAKVKLAK
jgi:hypothetical protein